jgi:hypothetical protein
VPRYLGISTLAGFRCAKSSRNMIERWSYDGDREVHAQRFNGSAEAVRDNAGLTKTTSDVL